MNKQPKPIHVFVSYAPPDEAHKKKLDQHLSVLKRQGIITSFDTGQIHAGMRWKASIQQHIAKADIILLLLSSDAIADDYIHQEELQTALKRANCNEVVLIPILVRPVHYEGLGLEQFAVLPSNKKPITTWENPDQAYHHIAEAIHKLAENIQEMNNSQATDFKPMEAKGENGHSPKEDVKKKMWTYLVGVGVVVSLLAGIAEFSGYSVRDVFGSDTKDVVDTNSVKKPMVPEVAKKFAFTVYVRDENGGLLTDINNHRKVALDLEDDNITVPVNAKGEAMFRLEPKYIGKTVHIQILKEKDGDQPYQSTTKDSLYTITANGKVNIVAVLDHLDKIIGRVTDFKTGKPIEKAEIFISDIGTFDVMTYSDAQGRFVLNIPKAYQRKWQLLHASKTNYQNWQERIPVHQQKNIPIRLDK